MKQQEPIHYWQSRLDGLESAIHHLQISLELIQNEILSCKNKINLMKVIEVKIQDNC